MSEPTKQLATVRTMQASDLLRVLTWRNHADVRRYMFTQHEITLAEHKNWFERATQDACKSLLIFEVDQQPLGYINFNKRTMGAIADWGFYLAPDAPKGSGRLLGHTALNYAFDELTLHKVCGEALAFNERSIRFHLSLGFIQEGILRDQFFDGNNYLSIINFGLLVNEWRSNNGLTLEKL